MTIFIPMCLKISDSQNNSSLFKGILSIMATQVEDDIPLMITNQAKMLATSLDRFWVCQWFILIQERLLKLIKSSHRQTTFPLSDNRDLGISKHSSYPDFFFVIEFPNFEITRGFRNLWNLNLVFSQSQTKFKIK